MGRKIKVCPFRVASITEPFLSKPGETTRCYFEPCIKENCPAYVLEHSDSEGQAERCLRLVGKE